MSSEKIDNDTQVKILISQGVLPAIQTILECADTSRDAKIAEIQMLIEKYNKVCHTGR